VMARNSEVPYMPDQNFSFSPDLKEFLTTWPTVSLRGPLHVSTLNGIFEKYQEMKKWLADSPAVSEVQSNKVAVDAIVQPA
jgi:hypothetical protein